MKTLQIRLLGILIRFTNKLFTERFSVQFRLVVKLEYADRLGITSEPFLRKLYNCRNVLNISKINNDNIDHIKICVVKGMEYKIKDYSHYAAFNKYSLSLLLIYLDLLNINNKVINCNI